MAGEGGGGVETTNSRQQDFIDIVLKWVTSENKTIHTRPPLIPPLKVGFLKYFLRVAQTINEEPVEGIISHRSHNCSKERANINYIPVTFTFIIALFNIVSLNNT